MTTGSEQRGDGDCQNAQHDNDGQDTGHGRGHRLAPHAVPVDSEAEIAVLAKTHSLRNELRVIEGGKSSGMPAAGDMSLEARIQRTLIWAAEQASEYYLKTLGRQPTEAERKDYACEITAIAHGSECAALINEPPGAA